MAAIHSNGGDLLEDLDKKKAQVQDKLQKRDEERLADVQKRRDDKSNVTAQHENADFFAESFAATEAEMYVQLQDSKNWPKSEIADRFDSLTVSVAKMERFLTESTIFLPAYVLQKAQATIKTVQADIQEKRDELLPKKKFAFKIKKKESLVHKDKAPQPEAKAQKQVLNIEQNECALTDKTDEKLTMNSSEINQKDVALARLKNCTVTLCGSSSAIHIDRLENCQIFSGPVSGSIFIDNCTDCTFVLACQQLRIHHTSKTDFYIHVTSRAIIEDTSTVRFAAYNWTYDGLDEHYQTSGLDKSRNSWDDVDDFNWLASDAKSPNWDVVPENETVQSWNK